MQQKLPLVSIVTPSYNKGRFIEETILSVKNQTYPRIEHIVIDGGSTDNTLDIIKKYEHTYDMRWVSEPDNGQSDAINKGWRMAKGEILGWLNADDTYMPWAVETAVKFLNDHPDVSMVYGDCNIINESGEISGKCQAKECNLKEMLCGENIIPQPAAFFRSEILHKVGNLDIKLYLAMDWDFWIRIGLSGLKLSYIPQLLANFRTYPETKMASEGHKTGLEHLYIADKVFSNPELPTEMHRLKRPVYSSAYRSIGTGYYAQYQMKQVRKYLMKSIMLYPLQIKNRQVVTTLVKAILGKRLVVIFRGWEARLGGN
jgi:glycosyltransferase involved in cell wall biosynthesis